MYMCHVKKKKKLSALLIKINFVWVYNSIFLLYIQIVRVVLTTQRQHQKWKTKSLKVQTQIKNLQAKVMEWVLRVKITVAHSVKSICQKLNSLFVKEQGSGEGLLRQLFWHYPKNTISQNLQGHTYLNFWKHSFLSQMRHRVITPLRRCWLKQWTSITLGMNCAVLLTSQ